MITTEDELFEDVKYWKGRAEQEAAAPMSPSHRTNADVGGANSSGERKSET